VVVAAAGVTLLLLPSPVARFGILLGAPLCLALLHVLRSFTLLSEAHRALHKQGKKGVLIYSDSPNWQSYIEEKWLPILGGQLVILNWSRRRAWSKRDIAVRLFEHFVGRTSQYNPAAIVLRGVRLPLVFRFYQAFRDARHGKSLSLRKLEESMFRDIAGAG
jgi:hypothetical protein